MRLEIKNLSYSYSGCDAVNDVNISVGRGEFVGIIGPNGSGKSTVLKNVYRALVPDKGEILLDGQNLLKMSRKKSAVKLAAVGQENDVPFDFTVSEIVAMGRSPHKRLFEADNENDRNIVRRALENVGMEHTADRNFQSLSGGEKQRVLLARAVAQECDFLVLDEPTNHLDISCQIQIFDFIKRLNVTVLSAVHDLNMAALYCDRIYVLKDGGVVIDGTPEQVLTSENIYDVFRVGAKAERHPLTGRLNIAFLPSFDKEEKIK